MTRRDNTTEVSKIYYGVFSALFKAYHYTTDESQEVINILNAIMVVSYKYAE